VRSIINAAFEKAINILKVRREVLEQGARLLLQKETLVEEDLKALKGALQRWPKSNPSGTQRAACSSSCWSTGLVKPL
jgi:hypothetical protein